MVALLASVMSRHDGREVVILCEECHSKMLAVGELLLLSCEARPVFTLQWDLELTKDTFVHYRDQVVDKLNHILITSRDISSQVHSAGIHWKPLAGRVQEMGSLVMGLTELSAHIGYMMAVNFAHCHPSRLGVVNKYKLHQAKLDLKFCCSRLKRSCVDDLEPHLLVELCSTMSKSLSSMTEVCKYASEKARDVEDQNQFKLCIKSITSTTSCLIASVKRFKSSPSIDHLRRIIAFCDPVVSASSALVTFASEEEFVGQAAKLSEKAAEAHKSVLGMTMSIVSASIQMCKAVRDLVYDVGNARHSERIRLCVDSTEKASSKLRDILLSCDFEPKTASAEPKTGAAPEAKTGLSKSKRSSGELAGEKTSPIDKRPGSGEMMKGAVEARNGSAGQTARLGSVPTTLGVNVSGIEKGSASACNPPSKVSPDDAQPRPHPLQTVSDSGKRDAADSRPRSTDGHEGLASLGSSTPSPTLNLSISSLGSISDVNSPTVGISGDCQADA